MASIEVNGARLDYVECGEGEPVVLVHGSASDRRTWHHQLDALGRNFRVIAYSRRYHWPNQPIARGGEYSMPEHVADLKSLIRALGLSSAHLVGHSYGAFVCLQLAISDPDTVRSLVLAEAPVFTLVTPIPPRPRDILRLFVTRPRMALAIANFGGRGLGPAIAATRRGDREEALRRLGTAILGRKFFRTLSDERLAQARANLIDAELLGSLFPRLTSDQLRAVRCPALLVNGDQSPPVLVQLSSLLGRLLPDVELVEIAGASHLMHEDEPPAFAAAVVSFLSRRGSDRGHSHHPQRGPSSRRHLGLGRRDLDEAGAADAPPGSSESRDGDARR